MNRGNVKKCLYFGTVALFLCGVGDWLLGYVPLGGEPIVFGVLNSNIVKVPSWFFIVDIPITIAFMYFVWKGTMKLPKVAVFMSPIGFSFLTKIIYAVRIAIGLEQYAFLAGCGESWGHALMCLAFWKSYRTYRDENGKAIKIFFDNYNKDLQKLLISPFDINLGYSV